MIALEGQKIDPAGLELPEEARNKRKATVKIRRNPPLPILPLIQKNNLGQINKDRIQLFIYRPISVFNIEKIGFLNQKNVKEIQDSNKNKKAYFQPNLKF